MSPGANHSTVDEKPSSADGIDAEIFAPEDVDQRHAAEQAAGAGNRVGSRRSGGCTAATRAEVGGTPPRG